MVHVKKIFILATQFSLKALSGRFTNDQEVALVLLENGESEMGIYLSAHQVNELAYFCEKKSRLVKKIKLYCQCTNVSDYIVLHRSGILEYTHGTPRPVKRELGLTTKQTQGLVLMLQQGLT